MSQDYLQLLAFSLLLFFFYLLEYLFPAFHSINNNNRKLTNISIGLFNFLIGSSLSIFLTLFVANFCKENNKANDDDIINSHENNHTPKIEKFRLIKENFFTFHLKCY